MAINKFLNTTLQREGRILDGEMRLIKLDVLESGKILNFGHKAIA
jgi:hypothetical protein